MSARAKKRKSIKYVEPELNIMPFIDVFGLLTTYLLFSAVFVSIGILEVQVPFISNAAPPANTEQVRTLEIKVELEKDKAVIKTSWTLPPQQEESFDFASTKEGVAAMHKKLVEIKLAHFEADSVTLFTEDDVTYESLTTVVDAIKLRWDGDPVFPAIKLGAGMIADDTSMFPKVVLGSVML